ncbi:hypothetical protein [Anaerosporobacter sp.]
MKQFANKGKNPTQGNGKATQGNGKTTRGNGKTSQGNGKTSQANAKTSKGKPLTDWDRYISKEAGVGKNTSKVKSKSTGAKKANKGSKTNAKVVAVKKPVIMNLFYMATEEYTCKQIVAPVVEEKGMEIQVWPELGIASIEFDESKSIDFQECEIESFDSDSDMEFVKEHGIKAIYEVTMDEAHKSKAANWFLSMIQTNGGFFCTDSDDFAPVYNKEELEKWR